MAYVTQLESIDGKKLLESETVLENQGLMYA